MKRKPSNKDTTCVCKRSFTSKSWLKYHMENCDEAIKAKEKEREKQLKIKESSNEGE